MTLDMKAMMEKYKQLQSRGKNEGPKDKEEDGVTYFTPKEGANPIRILPPLEGSQFFYVEFATHFGIGPNKRGITCLKSVGKDCPICRIVSDLYKNGDKELGNQMRAKSRYRVNMVDLEDTNAGVKIYEFGDKILEYLFGILSDSDYGDITSLQKGRTITVNRSGTSRNNTSYVVTPKPATRVLSDEWLEQAHNLAATVKLLSAEEIADILTGKAAVDETNAPLLKTAGKDYSVKEDSVSISEEAVLFPADKEPNLNTDVAKVDIDTSDNEVEDLVPPTKKAEGSVKEDILAQIKNLEQKGKRN